MAGAPHLAKGRKGRTDFVLYGNKHHERLTHREMWVSVILSDSLASGVKLVKDDPGQVGLESLSPSLDRLWKEFNQRKGCD